MTELNLNELCETFSILQTYLTEKSQQISAFKFEATRSYKSATRAKQKSLKKKKTATRICSAHGIRNSKNR